MCKKRNVLGCIADATSFMGYNNIQHFAFQSRFYCTIILKAQGSANHAHATAKGWRMDI